MGRPKGFKYTEETKRRIAQSLVEWYKLHSHHQKGKRHTEEARRKMSEWQRGRHLPEETKMRISLSLRGDKHPNWKGGLKELVQGIRHSPKYHQWRKAVLGRDNHTCQDCETTDNVDAHHIQSVIEYPEGIFEIDNGLTVCDSCHKRHTFWQRLKGKNKRKIWSKEVKDELATT